MIKKNYKKRRLLKCAFLMGREATEEQFYLWLDKNAPNDFAETFIAAFLYHKDTIRNKRGKK